MAARIPRSNDQIRSLILKYLYDRNANATSTRGKRGAAVKIMDMRRDLKQEQGLCCNEVMANLTYLISQGWVEEQKHARVVPVNGGSKSHRKPTITRLQPQGSTRSKVRASTRLAIDSRES